MTTAVIDQATETVVEKSVREFSFHDRCELCGFQAYIIARKPRTAPAQHEYVDDLEFDDLKFCKHHGERLAPSLANDGWDVLDFTDRINEKPSPSASDLD